MQTIIILKNDFLTESERYGVGHHSEGVLEVAQARQCRMKLRLRTPSEWCPAHNKNKNSQLRHLFIHGLGHFPFTFCCFAKARAA